MPLLLADAGFWPVHVDNTLVGVVLFLAFSVLLGFGIALGQRICAKLL